MTISNSENRILILMLPGENRRILAGWLSRVYVPVIPIDHGELDQDYDLCIVDTHGFVQCRQILKNRRDAVHPVFQPVLLTAPREQVNRYYPYFGREVDEWIAAPVDKRELFTRIEILLKLRQHTLDLAESKIKADDASRAKSDFLANISHEIRTPLNGITGMTDLILKTPLSDSQKHYARTIQSCADSLENLITDILDFSKIEAGKLELEHTAFGIREMLAEVRNILMYQVRQSKTSLDFEIAEDVPEHIKGDPFRLRQVILNLVGNALKFTHQGSVRVIITKKSDMDSHITLRFCVQDTGIGIPKSKLDKLFSLFSQVDSSFTRRRGGTGLGLVISKRLSELMGGDIGVESEEGKGSLFWFTATFEKTEKADVPCPMEAGILTDASACHFRRQHLKILVADDFKVNQEIMAGFLESHDVTTVDNGKDAVTLLKYQDFDLVFLDIQMPELDGYQTAKVIRDPDSRVRDHRIPVIAVTAHASKKDRDRCLAAGMNGYISKPYKAETLYSEMRKVLAAPCFEKEKPASCCSPVKAEEPASIDFPRVLNYMGGKVHIMERVCLILKSEIPEKLDAVKNALLTQDARSVERITHALKGGAKSLFATGAADIAYQVELAAKESDLEKAASLMPELEKQFNTILLELQQTDFNVQ